ncbi:MAG TPA: hypothetical protein DCS93_27620 [Microscillaceae bacterium]|nr:hypothetical protein [Microscillaceae bacterium]
MDKYYKYLIPALVITIFLSISFIYTSPTITGKSLRSNDIVQASGGSQELKDFEETNKRRPLWTNSMFSGMPAYMIYVDYPNSWTTKIGRLVTYQLGVPYSTHVIFLQLTCFYIFLLMLGKNHWVSILGAVGFTFATYNFSSIEAGHLAKLFAIAYVPPLIGAVIMTYRGKFLTGAALAALFASLELYANHIQITYYALIALLFYGVFAFVQAIQQKKLPQFAKATGLLLLAGGLAVGSQATRLLINYEYSKQTIRGKSELKSNTKSSGGLDRDYAFQWSQGIQETMSLFIPNYYGGASGQPPAKDSKTLKAIQTLASNPQLQKNQGFNRDLQNIYRRAASYWGGMPFTSSPPYLGATVLLLFIFSFFLTKNPLKWYLLGMTLLFLVISWGKNFPAFNFFLFDFAPLYNKFRAVTMALHLINIFMVWMIALGLQELFTSEIKLRSLVKPLMITAGATIGVILLGLLVADLGMQPIRDILAKYPDYIKSDIINAIKSDRSGMVRADAFRSIIFILLAAASLWVWFTGRFKREYAFALLIGLTLIDMWVIDKRYLNSDNYAKKSELNQMSQPGIADQFILKDSKDDPHYRVLNLTKSFSQDATTSFFHKSLGGYHGAKLRRYSEIIDQHFYRNINGAYRSVQAGNILGKSNTNDSTNFSVLNMLNMKYMIVSGNNNQEIVLKNPQSLGNAWFVDSYKIVKNSDEEIASLKVFDPKKVAFINPRYKNEVSKIKISPDPSATIKLTKYEPDYLVYESNAKGQQLAVFSEVYYNNGLGWDAYIDGKKVSHFRANYVLRALAVPGGKHKIEFKFYPKTFYQGESISLIASILIVLLFLAAAGLAYKNSRAPKEA